MTRFNNPPLPTPRHSDRHRSREMDGCASRDIGSPRKTASSRSSGSPPRASGSSLRSGGARSRRHDGPSHSADIYETSAINPAREQPGGRGTDASSRAGRRNLLGRRASGYLRDLISQDLGIEEAERVERPHRSRRAEARRMRNELRALQTTSRNAQEAANGFFETARDEYIANIDLQVMHLGESVRAIRETCHIIMQRPDTAPGLVPEDLASMLGRGFYGPPAIALARALPALCLHRGYQCGLRLFEERHLTPDPERPHHIMRRIFDACAVLCNTQNERALFADIQDWVEVVVEHIDEDKPSESDDVQRVIDEVKYVVYQVKRTLLSGVLKAATADLEEESE